MSTKQKGRPRKRPDYDHDKTMQEVLDMATALFGEPYDDRKPRDPEAPSINSVAKAMNTTSLRVRKLLVTAGYYSTDTSRKVKNLSDSGMTLTEIAEKTNLSVASVNTYLPYNKGIYNLEEKTLNADRAHKIKVRKLACEQLAKHRDLPDALNVLWSTIEVYQGYPFTTETGEHFRYSVSDVGIEINNGNLTIPKQAVEDAFRICKRIQKQDKSMCIDDKMVNGAAFLYSVFLRLGIIDHNK